MRSLALPLLLVTFGFASVALANGCGGDDTSTSGATGDGGGGGGGEGGGGGGGEGGSGGGMDGGSPFDPDSGVVVLPDGGVLSCGGSAADPAAATTVDGYIGMLGNAPPKGSAVRTAAIDAILKSCAMFGTPTAATTGWKPNYCWAHLAAAISTESGYMPNAQVKDSYATRQVSGMTANDPVVGMLQIRFSSTVHEMATYGAVNRLACVGCPLPASVATHDPNDQVYWAVTGPTANMTMMENVACNVGMGAWYYYENATGNGRASKVTYTNEYCAGGGTGADIITGLMSHLLGDEAGKGVIANDAQLAALKSTNMGAWDYVTTIKGNVDKMLGPVSGTHPFYMLLAPNPPAYCK